MNTSFDNWSVTLKNNQSQKSKGANDFVKEIITDSTVWKRLIPKLTTNNLYFGERGGVNSINFP